MPVPTGNYKSRNRSQGRLETRPERRSLCLFVSLPPKFSRYGQPIMQVSEIMVRLVHTIPTNATLEEASHHMRDENIGFLAVVEEAVLTDADVNRDIVEDTGPLPLVEMAVLVGALTDRDVIVRAIAAGMDPGTTLVSEIMSQDVAVCHQDEISRRPQPSWSKKSAALVRPGSRRAPGGGTFSRRHLGSGYAYSRGGIEGDHRVVRRDKPGVTREVSIPCTSYYSAFTD